MKKIIYFTLITLISIASTHRQGYAQLPTQSNNLLHETQLEEDVCNEIDEITFNENISLEDLEHMDAENPVKYSYSERLQLLKAYLIMQKDLCKNHIVSHATMYKAWSLILLAAGTIAYAYNSLT